MIRQRIQLFPHRNPCRCLLILMPSTFPAATKIGKFAVFVSLANSPAKFTKITKFRNSGKEMPPDGWRIFRSFFVLSFCYLHSLLFLIILVEFFSKLRATWQTGVNDNICEFTKSAKICTKIIKLVKELNLGHITGLILAKNLRNIFARPIVALLREK